MPVLERRLEPSARPAHVADACAAYGDALGDAKPLRVVDEQLDGNRVDVGPRHPSFPQIRAERVLSLRVEVPVERRAQDQAGPQETSQEVRWR